MTTSLKISWKLYQNKKLYITAVKQGVKNSIRLGWLDERTTAIYKDLVKENDKKLKKLRNQLIKNYLKERFSKWR